MAIHVDISQGLRIDDLERLQAKVHLRGGRLVAYSEVISAVILSARSYHVRWIPRLEERRSSGWISSAVTVVLGWWAFPGPLWSLTALVWNFRGGVDLTDGLMAAYSGNKSPIGYSDMSVMERFHDEARALALKILWCMVAIFIAWFAYAIWHQTK